MSRGEGARARGGRSDASSRKGRGARSRQIASGGEDAKEGGEREAQGLTSTFLTLLPFGLIFFRTARATATVITAYMGANAWTRFPCAWGKHAPDVNGEYIGERAGEPQETAYF